MRNRLFFVGCCFLGGIVVSSIRTIPLLVVLLILMVLCAALLLFQEQRYRQAVLLGMIFILGVGWYGIRNGRESSIQRYEGKTITIDAVVLDDGTAGEYTTRYLVKLAGTREKAIVFSKKATLSFGDKIRVRGEVEAIRGQSNPHTFDFAAYNRSKGIYENISANQVKVLAKDQAGMVRTLLYRTKNRMKTAIFTALPAREAGVLYGILSGDKTMLDEDTKEAYQQAGIAHILAVSGLHVGFLSMMLEAFLGLFIRRRQLRSILLALLLLFYVASVGMPPSAMRAYLMVLMLMGASCLRREYDFLSAISAAMIVLLLFNPLSIHDTGFVISFACVYSIAFLSTPLKRVLRFLPVQIRSAIALSLAIQIGTLPLLVNYFHTITPLNFIMNLFAIPLAMGIVLYGFAGLVISAFSMGAGIFAFSVSYYLIRLLTWLVSVSTHFVPAVVVPHLSIVFALSYYVGVIAVFLVRRRWMYGCFVALLTLSFCLFWNPWKETTILYLDVGQGDGTLIQTGRNVNVLIDGGPGENGELLLSQGVGTLDAAVITHFDSDHANGVIDAIRTLRVKRVIIPAVHTASENFREVERLCRKKSIPLFSVSAGDQINLRGNVTMKVLWPARGIPAGEDNESAIVLDVRWKSLDLLFTSDVSMEVEKKLLHLLRKYEIIKVGHHGSRFSTSQELLQVTVPKVAVIQVGRNSFGHPTKEVLERLQEAGVRTYRTDRDGAVIVKTNGRTMKIKTML